MHPKCLISNKNIFKNKKEAQIKGLHVKRNIKGNFLKTSFKLKMQLCKADLDPWLIYATGAVALPGLYIRLKLFLNNHSQFSFCVSFNLKTFNHSQYFQTSTFSCVLLLSGAVQLSRCSRHYQVKKQNLFLQKTL